MSTTTSNTCTYTYQVEGMTCAHCAHAVSTEVGAIDGVHEVGVDLGTGVVTVHSDRQPTQDEMASAVDEAGYRLVS